MVAAGNEKRPPPDLCSPPGLSSAGVLRHPLRVAGCRLFPRLPCVASPFPSIALHCPPCGGMRRRARCVPGFFVRQVPIL